MQPEIVADTLASATEEMTWNSALLSQYRVIRRNGQVTPFDGHKIAAAMTKAFLAVEGDTAKNSTRIQNAVATHTRQVINNISRRLTERGMVHIEDIQDQVELALMRAGEHKVARAYVLYREQHAQRRAQQPNKPQMHITKTSGELVTLDQDRLRAVVSEACLGLAYVDANLIVEDCLKNLFDGIPEADVNRALVMSSRTLVEKEPNYSYVTARLLLDHLRQEALNFLDFPAKTATAAEMSSYYARYLPLYLEAGIKHELLNPKLREYDLGILGAALKPERDFQFTYLGLQTLYDRYFLHWDEVRFELPQAFFMRVAMGLALNEENKEQRAIEFYNLLSSFDFMSSTPTLFNSGSLRSQLSSCFLTTVPDDLEGIYGAIKDNAMLQKWAGGIGNDWSNVRGMGSLIKGTNGKSQGVVPFLKVANDTLVAVNQCFAPDTLIFTADGIKPIKEVKRGDLVLGQRGAYREVQENFAYLHQRDDMVELTVKHAITPLQVSAGHPFFAIKNVPMNQSIARTKAQLAAGKIYPAWADVGTLQKGDYVAQVIPHEIVPVADFTEEDARLYGILLGDGHCSRRKQEWGVSGNPSCDAHLAFVRDYLSARGIHFWEAERNERFTQIRWSYSAAVERCGTTGRFVGAGEAVLPFGRDDLYTAQGEKYIARRFAHLPPAQTLALLQGLLETDGGISRGKEIYFTSSSLPLVEGIRYQCLRMGIATAGQKRLRDTTHDATRVDGTALHFKGESLSYDIRIPAVPTLASRLGCQALTKYNWFIHNNHLFSRVRACEPMQPIPVIHDLKVEGDESYMTTAALAHNGGRRRGSGCAYLESWHIDIEEFLELRKNTGDERRRTHDMNTANWIPDLFMQRVHENGSWTLFSPNETPDLHDLYGEAFRTAYESYEQLAETGKIRVWKRVAAVELWRKMLSMLFETGHPWITFKDVCNLRSPQQHVGVVHSSNLCTEICLNTKSYPDPIKNQQEGEIAVCNLASINLANHIQDGKLDIEKLQRTIRTGMRMLDNVVELNYYAVPQSRNANLQHRPVGMGIMGFQDALYQLQIPYASQAAVDFADQSMEVVSYYAIHASTELAAERGRYKSFEGSLWSKGILPVDSIQFVVKSRPSQYLEIDTRSTLDWDALRQRVTQIGMRNSNCMAIAPTACVIADTLVAGKNGLLQMDEIGDVTGETWQAIELIVNQQSASSAASKFYCNGVRAVRTVTTANGHAVTGTDNHRLKVLSSENKLEWKFLKDIALDDLVAHRLGGYEATEIQSIRALGEQGSNAKETNLPHCLDEGMAVFLGAYMANGYVKYKLDGTPEAVKISLNTNRLEFLEMLRNLGKSWGVYSADEESQGVTTLCFYSVELGRLFVEENWSKPLGNKGEGAAGAFIPRKIRMSPKVIIAKFLQGLFTDGSLTFQERGSPVVEMSTVSEKLASQLHTLLWALGYMTTRLKSQSGSLGLREVHRVRIANVNHTLKFLRAVGWHTQEFLSKALSYEGSAQDGSRGLRVSGHSLIAEIQALDGLSQETKNFLATAKHQGHLSFNALEEIATENERVKNTLAWQLMVEGILLLPVVSNEQQQKVVPTFDIEVPNKHEYVANSMVNHNTISNIVGVSQSIEPTYQNLFVKSNLSGEFTVINPYLINELRQRGLWDEAMVNDLKYFDGSLRYIERIPQDLQDLYATAFEIDPAWLIEAAARRQKWIDQSQSLNLYMLEPSGRKLDSLYKLAWLRGLKTTYYLRSMGATHVEKSTIRDRKLNAVSNEPAPQVCSIDNPDCESCQ